MARPKKIEKDLKKDFHIRLSDSEKDKITQYAKKANLSLSEYVRRAALRKKLPKPLPGINKANFVELIRQGNNLNQLTKQVNGAIAEGLRYKLNSTERELIDRNYQLLKQILAQLRG